SRADTFVEAIGKIDDRVILIIDSDKLLKEDTITELTKIL
ncbi:MAG: chemotaxis protein CheW, partial [Clostridiales bacterium]|nr:chemotaxis protein CheW [Clostridiales bacterium]